MKNWMACTMSAWVDTSYLMELKNCEGCGAPKCGNECDYCGGGKKKKPVVIPPTNEIVRRSPSIWSRLFG